MGLSLTQPGNRCAGSPVLTGRVCADGAATHHARLLSAWARAAVAEWCRRCERHYRFQRLSADRGYKHLATDFCIDLVLK